MINISETLHYLDIKEDMAVAEFGCGSADFTLALAKKVNHGKVYALDIQEDKLSALKSKISHQHLHNISLVLCDLEAENGSTLQNGLLDIIVIPNVLFQAENKSGIISEAKRALKTGGQLLIIDWLANAPFGPKENLALPEEIKTIAQNLGFALKREFSASDYHYGLLFNKE